MGLLSGWTQKKQPVDDPVVRESDECLEGARRAFDMGDADAAMALLARARRLTPLREEIRVLALEIMTRRAAMPEAPGPSAAMQAMPATAAMHAMRGMPAMPAMQAAPAPAPAPAAAPAANPAPAAARHSPERVYFAEAPSPLKMAAPQRAAPAPTPAPASAPIVSVPIITPAPETTSAAPVAQLPQVPHAARVSSRPGVFGWMAGLMLLGCVAVASGVALHGRMAALLSGDREKKTEHVIPPELAEQLSQAEHELRTREPLRSAARLQLALERWPAEAKSIHPHLADAYYAQAERLVQEESYKQAAEYYEKCMALAPERTAAGEGMGWCYYMLGRLAQDRHQTRTARDYFQKSLAAYEQVIEGNPLSARSLLGKARVYSAQSRRQEAVENYRAVITRYPNSPEAAEAGRRLRELTGRHS